MAKISSNTHTAEQLDHHSNQLNPNNEAFQANLDNRANQLNPNHSEYRGVNNDNSKDSLVESQVKDSDDNLEPNSEVGPSEEHPDNSDNQTDHLANVSDDTSDDTE